MSKWHDLDSALAAHPPNKHEHLVPLLVVVGASQGSHGKNIFNESFMGFYASMFSFE
jgi:hypothetical protein